MEIKEELQKIVKWLQDLYTVQTQDVIDRLNMLINSISTEEQVKEETDKSELEAKAKEYLKSIKYKWLNFLKWERLIEVAKKSWFNEESN